MILSFILNTLPKILSLIIETLLGYLMLSKTLKTHSFRGQSIVTTCYIAIHICLLFTKEYLLPSPFRDSYFLYLFLHYSLFLLYGFLISCKQPVICIFLALVYLSSVTLCRFPLKLLEQVLLLFNFQIPIDSLRTIIDYLGSSLCLGGLTFFFIKFRPDNHYHYPASYYVTMTVTPLLNMLAITVLKEYFAHISSVINVLGTSCLTIELLIYFMIHQSTNEYNKRVQLELVNQQMNYQAQHMEELNTIVTEYHHLRHDTKNHFACIDRLLSQGKYENLKEYFYTLSKEIYALDNQIETGNEIVNQVINIKYATASKLQIPMEIHIALPHQLNIPDHQLCSLISNLLDNALEASQTIENPEIFIEMKMVKAYLSLTVRNRIDHSQQVHAFDPGSSKSDGQLHGLGRQIIKDIVKKHNGISTIEAKDYWYTASILLELEEL